MMIKRRILIIDDEPEEPIQLYTKAINIGGEYDKKYDPIPVIIKDPEDAKKNVNVIKDFDIVLLDIIFNNIQEGHKILKKIIELKKQDGDIHTRVIILSTLRNYQRWDRDTKLENFIKFGVDFISKRAAEKPVTFKFMLDRHVFEIEQEKKLIAHNKRLQKEERKQISQVPIEITQRKGPDLEGILALDGNGEDRVIPILIHGDTGTGKGFLSTEYRRRLAESRNIPIDDDKLLPFHHVNCAAFSHQMITEELFGVCKGTATDAAERKGWFEKCDKGILFLDEFEALNNDIQARILVVIDQGKFYRAHGGINHKEQDQKERPADQKKNPEDHTKEIYLQNLKVLVAFNKDVEALIESKELRIDFIQRFDYWYKMKNLTEYNEDEFKKMVDFYVQRNNEIYKKRSDFSEGKKLSKDAVEYLLEMKDKLGGEYGGNLRQLQKWIKRSMVMTDKALITVENLIKHFSYEISPEFLTTAVERHTKKKPKKMKSFNESELIETIVEMLFIDYNETNKQLVDKYEKAYQDRLNSLKVNIKNGEETFNFLKENYHGEIKGPGKDELDDLIRTYLKMRNCTIQGLVGLDDYKEYLYRQPKNKMAIAKGIEIKLLEESKNARQYKIAMIMGMTRNNFDSLKRSAKDK